MSNRVMTQVKTFLRLKWSMRFLIIKVFVMIGAFRMALDFLPFRKILSFLKGFSPSEKKRSQFYEFSQGQIAWSVRKVSGVLLKDRPCLVQAMVLWILYLRRGYDARLYIGVKKEHPETIRAHAWVESDGYIAIGFVPDLGEYRVLPQFL